MLLTPKFLSLASHTVPSLIPHGCEFRLRRTKAERPEKASLRDMTGYLAQATYIRFLPPVKRSRETLKSRGSRVELWYVFQTSLEA